MFTVFSCRKCNHQLYIDEKKDFPRKLERIAGMACPNCGERKIKNAGIKEVITSSRV